MSTETAGLIPDVSWTDIARLRTLLAHHYHRVDPDQVWVIAANDVPAMTVQLSSHIRASTCNQQVVSSILTSGSSIDLTFMGASIASAWWVLGHRSAAGLKTDSHRTSRRLRWLRVLSACSPRPAPAHTCAPG